MLQLFLRGLVSRCCPQLTHQLFSALSAVRALPRRWHLDGRFGAVQVVEGRRRLVLSAEAAAAVSASFQGWLGGSGSGGLWPKVFGLKS